MDQNLPLAGLSKEAMLRVSRIQYGVDLFPFGVCSNDDILRYIFYATSKAKKRKPKPHHPSLERVLSGEQDLPIDKVSSAHLRHYTVNELRSFDYNYLKRNIGFILDMTDSLIVGGARESLVVGLIVWALLLPVEHRELMAASGIWAWDIRSDSDFFARIKKDFTCKLKAVQNLLPLDLTPFFELEVLVNRGIGEVDWIAEREHRTNPNLANIDTSLIFQQTVDLFGRLRGLGARPTKLNWDAYWSSRWQWAPTGAFHSQYSEDMQYRAKSGTLRHKLYSYCAMPKLGLEHFSSRNPEIVAWPSTKYEWGKQRAIYGVDSTSFIMSGFSMAGCEEVLAKLFPIGPAATQDNVSKSVDAVLKSGIPYCFDFEDFNSQHSTASMVAVLNAYLHSFSSDLSLEQKGALIWTIKSINNSFVRDKVLGTYKTSGTLLSGWRLTTFINTILNYVYTSICKDGLHIASTHNGDDVLSSVRTFKEVQTIQHNAQKYNIRFQKSKCYVGAIAEFLRVDHRVGVGAQYMARGVATYVHGPTEAALPNDLINVLRSIQDRKNELLQRQANPEMLAFLTKQQLQYVAKIWKVDYKTITQIISTHISLGGLEKDVNRATRDFEVKRVLEPRPMDEKLKMDTLRSLPGVYEYARKLTRTLVSEAYTPVLVKAAKRTILAATVAHKFGVTLIKRQPDNSDFLNFAQYGMLRGEAVGIKVSAAKSFGIPLIAINADWTYIGRKLAEEVDPVKAMKILL